MQQYMLEDWMTKSQSPLCGNYLFNQDPLVSKFICYNYMYYMMIEEICEDLKNYIYFKRIFF